MKRCRRSKRRWRCRLAAAGRTVPYGSQIFDIAPFEEAARVMLHFMDDVRKETGYTSNCWFLGGGFWHPVYRCGRTGSLPGLHAAGVESGSRYVPGTVAAWYRISTLNRAAPLWAKPGLPCIRWAPSREIPGVRNYVSVDGGMTDNPRYILYQSSYDVLLATMRTKNPIIRATIAGRCCESGDPDSGKRQNGETQSRRSGGGVGDGRV